MNQSEKWIFPPLALEQARTHKLSWEGFTICFSGGRSFYEKIKLRKKKGHSASKDSSWATQIWCSGTVTHLRPVSVPSQCGWGNSLMKQDFSVTGLPVAFCNISFPRYFISPRLSILPKLHLYTHMQSKHKIMNRWDNFLIFKAPRDVILKTSVVCKYCIGK